MSIHVLSQRKGVFDIALNVKQPHSFQRPKMNLNLNVATAVLGYQKKADSKQEKKKLKVDFLGGLSKSTLFGHDPKFPMERLIKS